MPNYEVNWLMPIEDAFSPEEAARKAREIQLDPESIATIFHVKNVDTGRETIIDLDNEDD